MKNFFVLVIVGFLLGFYFQKATRNQVELKKANSTLSQFTPTKSPHINPIVKIDRLSKKVPIREESYRNTVKSVQEYLGYFKYGGVTHVDIIKLRANLVKDSGNTLDIVNSKLATLPDFEDGSRQLLVQLVPILNVPYSQKISALTTEALNLSQLGKETNGNVRGSSLVAFDLLGKFSQNPDFFRKTFLRIFIEQQGNLENQKILIDRFATLDPVGYRVAKSKYLTKLNDPDVVMGIKSLVLFDTFEKEDRIGAKEMIRNIKKEM